MYKINDLSKILDVSSNTIRRYESYGYITPARNDENNYRSYSNEDVDSIIWARKYRAFDFSHSDTVNLMSQDMDGLIDTYQKRVDEAAKQIELLRDIRNRLKQDIRLFHSCYDNVGRFIVLPNIDYTFLIYRKGEKMLLDNEHIELMRKFIDHEPFVQQICYFSTTEPTTPQFGLGLKTQYIEDKSILDSPLIVRYPPVKCLFYYGKDKYDPSYFLSENVPFTETSLYKKIQNYLSEHGYNQTGEIYLFDTAIAHEGEDMVRYFIATIPIG